MSGRDLSSRIILTYV